MPPLMTIDRSEVKVPVDLAPARRVTAVSIVDVLVNRKWFTVPAGSPDVARASGNCTLQREA
jgi:hypothetical protein